MEEGGLGKVGIGGKFDVVKADGGGGGGKGEDTIDDNGNDEDEAAGSTS